ncbi:hypothetical protein EYF80_012330 [Liparis tanakae]|uniref:Uncharacterized protein n=1 Tax=Liparis tanakae TaxID=230148 RepID=A0A4Z2IHV8_9TELE|nr:hypothetical protein EYF80_012330 [Liparis tanakae]
MAGDGCGTVDSKQPGVHPQAEHALMAQLNAVSRQVLGHVPGDTGEKFGLKHVEPGCAKFLWTGTSAGPRQTLPGPESTSSKQHPTAQSSPSPMPPLELFQFLHALLQSLLSNQINHMSAISAPAVLTNALDL